MFKWQLDTAEIRRLKSETNLSISLGRNAAALLYFNNNFCRNAEPEFRRHCFAAANKKKVVMIIDVH